MFQNLISCSSEKKFKSAKNSLNMQKITFYQKYKNLYQNVNINLSYNQSM